MKKSILLLTMFFSNVHLVKADELTESSFCVRTSPIWQFGGYILFVLKILIPLIIIVLGIIDYAKAMTSNDDASLKKTTKSLALRFISGVVIFFIPTLVHVIFDIIGNVVNLDGIDACQTCLLTPLNNSCDSYIAESENLRENEYNDPVPGSTNLDQVDPNNFGGGTNGGSANSTYTSTKNNIRYNLYYQNDSRWGGTLYSDGATIEERGCMITAVAVISSASNRAITPLSVFNSSHVHNHPHYGIPALTNNNFNCYNSTNTSSSYISSQLNQGNVAVVMVYGNTRGGSSNFTTSQHYMALLDIRGEQVFVGNGYGNYNNATTGWYALNDVINSIQYLAICEPSQTLLNRY